MNCRLVSLNTWSMGYGSHGVPTFITDCVVSGGIREECLRQPAVKSFQYYRTDFSPALGSP